jgi:hypothetical protein
MQHGLELERRLASTAMAAAENRCRKRRFYRALKNLLG